MAILCVSKGRDGDLDQICIEKLVCDRASYMRHSLVVDKVLTARTPPADSDGMLLSVFIEDLDISALHPLPFRATTLWYGMTIIRAGRSGAHIT